MLAAPILEAGAKVRTVYLPQGVDWIEMETGKHYEGGKYHEIPVKLAAMPVFLSEEI